jgi:hypothetical protein
MASDNALVFSFLVILMITTLIKHDTSGVLVIKPLDFIVAVFGQGLILETYVTNVFSDVDIPILLSLGLSVIVMFI